METSVRDRIMKIIDNYFHGNISAAGRELDIPQSTIKMAKSDKEYKPSYENLVKILSNKNLNINPQWLIFGRGEMNSSSIVVAPAETYGIDYKEKYYAVIEELVEVRRELDNIKTKQLASKKERTNAAVIVKDAKVG